MAFSLDLTFIAPVAVGSEVLILPTEAKALLSGTWKPSDYLVLSLTTGILFGPEWMPVDLDPKQPDLEARTSGRYRASRELGQLRARVVRCVVRSRGWGDLNDLNTRLEVEPIAAGG